MTTCPECAEKAREIAALREGLEWVLDKSYVGGRLTVHEEPIPSILVSENGWMNGRIRTSAELREMWDTGAQP